MGDATRSGSSDQEPDDEGGRSLGLTGEVRSLREELAGLRQGLAGEVRTRRIVVVEDDGFERCSVQARGSHATVTLAARSAPGASTAVELFVHDAMDGDGPSVGVALIDGGDVVASFSLVSPQRPALWIGDDPRT